MLRIVGDPTDDSPGLNLKRLPFAEFRDKWLTRTSAPLALFVFASVYLAIVDIGAAAWFTRGLVRREFTRADLLLWAIAGYLLLAGYPSSRFRVPVMPLLALYAARGIVAGRGRSREAADAWVHVRIVR